MRRHAAVLGICCAAWSGVARADAAAAPSSAPASASASAPAPAPSSPPAPAPGTPGASQIQFAAREHDLGYRAYINDDFDEAASHFENAFFAAPNPAELRSAIRARRDAGELARAATLAAIGLRRFPGDPATGKVAADVIAQARPRVFEVLITSSSEYSVAIDDKIVAAERVKESRLFVTPGAHELLVSWSDERNTRIPIDAREGGTQSLELEPPAVPAPVVVPVPAPVPAVAPVPAPVPAPAPPQPLASKPFGPAVFVAGAALTAIGAGLIVWSGVETLNKPGADTVRQECRAGRPDCQPLYDQGHAWQTRTNVFVAVTSVLGAVTGVVGLFFTEWSPPATTSGARPASPSARTVAPVLEIGRVGLEGTF